MTLNNISVSQYIVGKLRKAIIDGDLTDYNANNRNGNNFIYPDSPMIQILMKNKNNFPRISIESVSQSSDHRLGQMSDSYLMRETLKITCYSVRDLICPINTVTDESHAYVTGTSEYELDSLPYSDITAITGTKTGVAYTFIKNTDYQVYDSDFDGMRDSVKWIADTPDNGTNFLVSYKRNAIGSEIVRLLSQNINEFFRKNWRLNFSENKIFNYKLLSSNPITFEEDSGLYRWEITVQFSTFDGIETT